MALKDTIARNSKLLRRTPGGLTEETTEEIQSLAGKAGIAPPTTPVGAAMIGANADQQKMMGDKRQKQAALSLANPTLQDTLRTAQSRTQMTTGEQAQAEKSEFLQNLGHLGERVNSYITAERGKLAAAATAPGPVEVKATEQIPAASPQNLPQLKDLLKSFRADPQNMQTLLQINQMLGRDVNSALAPAEVDSLYESTVESIARSGAGIVDDALTAEDLSHQPGFGYSVEQLAALLDVPPETARTMTVGGIKDRVNQLAQAEFSNVQQLGQVATGRGSGAAERALSRSLLREASSTGVRSVEQSVADLQDQISNADMVSFAGRQFRVDDLLKDDTISGIISEYLSSPPGSPVRDQLEKTEPSLVAFVQRNEQLLGDASKSLQQSTAEFQQIQKENQQVGRVGGAEFSKKILSEFLPDYGKLKAQRYDPNSVPVIRAAKELPPGEAETFVNSVNALTEDPKVGSEITQELRRMSSDDLKKLELNKGITDSRPVQAFLENRREYDAVSAIDPADDEAIYEKWFGADVKMDQLRSSAAETNSRKTLGLPTKDSILDRDNDGQLDHPTDLLETMKKETPKISLRDAISGNPQVFRSKDVGPTLAQPQLNTLQQTVMDRLGESAKDGHIRMQEVADAFSEDELYAIKDSHLNENWGTAAAGVEYGIGRHRQHRTNILLEEPKKVLEKFRPTRDAVDKLTTPYAPEEEVQVVVAGPRGIPVLRKTTVSYKADIPSKEREDKLQDVYNELEHYVNHLENAKNGYGNRVDQIRLSTQQEKLRREMEAVASMRDIYKQQREQAEVRESREFERQKKKAEDELRVELNKGTEKTPIKAGGMRVGDMPVSKTPSVGGGMFPKIPTPEKSSENKKRDMGPRIKV